MYIIKIIITASSGESDCEFDSDAIFEWTTDVSEEEESECTEGTDGSDSAEDIRPWKKQRHGAPVCWVQFQQDEHDGDATS